MPDTEQQQDKDEELQIEEAAGQMAEILESNPDLLERVMSSPGVMRIVQHQISSFQGPLPPPSMLADYEKILPGAAERILSLTEREQTGRHSTRETALKGALSKDSRGQWMGFIITISVLIIASVFAWRGNTIFAGTLIGLDLLGLAAVFVVGRLPDKKEK